MTQITKIINHESINFLTNEYDMYETICQTVRQLAVKVKIMWQKYHNNLLTLPSRLNYQVDVLSKVDKEIQQPPTIHHRNTPY